MDLLWTQSLQQLCKSYWHLIACLAAPFRRQVTKCQRKTCCDLPGEVGTSDPTLACGEVADMWNLFRQVAKKVQLAPYEALHCCKAQHSTRRAHHSCRDRESTVGYANTPNNQIRPSPPSKGCCMALEACSCAQATDHDATCCCGCSCCCRCRSCCCYCFC